MQLSKLRKLGLSENEAKVYLACLEVGHGSVQQIAEHAELPKSTVADVSKKMLKNGLLGIYMKKKRRQFVAASPHVLQEKISKAQELFTQTLPELLALYGGGTSVKPAVRLYEGRAGLGVILSEILAEATTMIGIGSVDELFVKMQEYFPSFPKERAKRRIPIRVILQDSPTARQRKAMGPQELREVKLMKSAAQFHCIIWIWNNKIASCILGAEMAFLVIESKELANMHRAMFEQLWSTL